MIDSLQNWAYLLDEIRLMRSEPHGLWFIAGGSDTYLHYMCKVLFDLVKY